MVGLQGDVVGLAEGRCELLQWIHLEVLERLAGKGLTAKEPEEALCCLLLLLGPLIYHQHFEGFGQRRLLVVPPADFLRRIETHGEVRTCCNRAFVTLLSPRYYRSGRTGRNQMRWSRGDLVWTDQSQKQTDARRKHTENANETLRSQQVGEGVDACCGDGDICEGLRGCSARRKKE